MVYQGKKACLRSKPALGSGMENAGRGEGVLCNEALGFCVQ